MKQEPRVFIVDDDPDMRRSLRWLLESADYWVEVFASAEEFLGKYRRGTPGCMILDVRMPGMGGLNLLHLLRREDDHLPIILFTGHGDIPMAVSALKAGAFDFVEKPPNRKQILDRITDALAVDREQREINAAVDEIAERMARLTQREREVLDKLAEGESTRGIATALQLSEKTIEKYRAALMDKMGTRSLGKLIRMVMAYERRKKGQLL